MKNIKDLELIIDKLCDTNQGDRVLLLTLTTRLVEIKNNSRKEERSETQE